MNYQLEMGRIESMDVLHTKAVVSWRDKCSLEHFCETTFVMAYGLVKKYTMP